MWDSPSIDKCALGCRVAILCFARRLSIRHPSYACPRRPAGAMLDAGAEKDVKAAIGAARAKQARKEMI
jgi:hypothetical protein